MKSSHKLLFIGLTIAFLLNSCSIEKRVYMPGYHSQWYKQNNNALKQELESTNNSTLTNKNQNISFEISKNETNTIDDYVAPKVNDDNITASLNNKSLIIQSHKAITFNKKVNSLTASSNSPSKIETIVSNKEEIKNKLRELKANNSSDDSGGSVALLVIGWIILILGLLILLFASILAGALLMLLGLIFVITGSVGRKKGVSSSPQTNNKTDKSEYVDVVYLKNGSIIRGMIIEQTPNVSMKIQTKDGSVFVYKMEEVEKMTKELSR